MRECLITWEKLRRNDKNVRAEIERCKKTNCSQHKSGSESALKYRDASKSLSHFIAYLLCPPRQYDELAVKISTEPSDYDATLDAAKARNIATAVAMEKRQKDIYLASGSNKGFLTTLIVDFIILFSSYDIYRKISPYENVTISFT
jgi:hypothetical protein